MSQERFASVVLPLAVRQGDHPYSYHVPPSLAGRIRVGTWVEVPFGSRCTPGWVVEVTGQCPVAEVKDIKRVLSDFPAFDEELLALSRWIAEVYLCPLGTVLKSLAPAWLNRSTGEGREEVLRLAVPSGTAREALASLKRAPKQAQVLTSLLERGEGASLGVREAGVKRSVLRSLEARGLVKLEKTANHPFPEDRQAAPQLAAMPYNLAEGQRVALSAVREGIQAGRFQAFLLHGVTGSGKTEVYLQAIATVVAQGKQAIFLVPEIALTPQMVGYLQERFGPLVAVLHSRLSEGERSRAWQRLAQGHAMVAVGARSAVFAPVPHLGLIVVDEEQESSYKQEVNPRYHTRDVALKRAQLASAVLLLGTATPSLETYYWARRGFFRLLRLNQRVDGRQLPEVKVVDMRRELRNGNTGIFSGYLRECLAAVLSRGEQALFFINRRGYHPFVACRTCGEALRCPSCEITLTYHQEGKTLRCHYCGYSRPATTTCPLCGGEAWVGWGSGTQRVEAEIYREWPRARVLRLDADVVGRRGAHERIYETFRRGNADILVGTQMVAKGFNFPNLTLVGVIDADVTLNLPDFRARERTFQLLTQVAGRAGRGDKPGQVVVQTFHPEDHAVRAASEHDYPAFYRREILQRRRLGYPPYSHLLLIMITAPQEERARAAAKELYQGVAAKTRPGLTVLGPAPAPLARIENRYRYQLILKGTPPGLLREAARKALAGFRPKAQVRVTVDVNPLLML